MRRSQHGQALPLGLALLAAGSLGALVLFNTGQVATDKARIANTADSAAYSGMLWQARAMNFQAYTNRAMVANQVSMAQAVSLNSWVGYAEQTSQNIATALAGVPFVNAFTSGFAQVMRVVAQIVQPITDAMVSVIDIINGGLEVSQEAMFVSSFIATPDVVRKVVEASDPRFESDTAYSLAGLYQNLDQWNSFTEGFEADDLHAMGERAGTIMQSRDDFTDGRNWEFFDSFWFYSTPFTRHKIFREGDTRLVMLPGNGGGEPRWEWMAKDTLAFQTRVWRPFGSTKKIELPIGWGSSYANSEDASSFVQALCRRNFGRTPEGCRYVGTNTSTEEVADRFATRMTGYSGVRAFRSLSVASRELDGHDPMLRLRTEVAMDLPDTRTSDDLVTGDRFDTNVVGPGGKMSSVSVAEVYYRRPDAYTTAPSSKRREAANGYNPYWDVRLGPVSLEERLVALGLRSAEDGGGSAPPPYEGTPDLGDDGNGTADGSGGGNGDQGGGAGGGSDPVLPAFASSMAQAYGVDASGVQNLVNGRVGISADLVEGFARQQVGEIRSMLEDELEDAVDDAVEEIIRGIASSAIGQRTQEIAEQVVNNEGVQQLQGLQEDAEELSDRLEAIRVDVATAFQIELDAATAEFEIAFETAQGDIDAAEADIEAAVLANEDVTELTATRDELVEIRDALRDDLADELTDELTDIIERFAGDWASEIESDLTRRIVNIILDDYFDGEDAEDVLVEEFLPWGD